MTPYFQPEWIAYFISLIAVAIALYAVYIVVELRDYVVKIKQNIKNKSSFKLRLFSLRAL